MGWIRKKRIDRPTRISKKISNKARNCELQETTNLQQEIFAENLRKFILDPGKPVELIDSVFYKILLGENTSAERKETIDNWYAFMLSLRKDSLTSFEELTTDTPIHNVTLAERRIQELWEKEPDQLPIKKPESARSVGEKSYEVQSVLRYLKIKAQPQWRFNSVYPGGFENFKAFLEDGGYKKYQDLKDYQISCTSRDDQLDAFIIYRLTDKLYYHDTELLEKEEDIPRLYWNEPFMEKFRAFLKYQGIASRLSSIENQIVNASRDAPPEDKKDGLGEIKISEELRSMNRKYVKLYGDKADSLWREFRELSWLLRQH